MSRTAGGGFWVAAVVLWGVLAALALATTVSIRLALFGITPGDGLRPPAAVVLPSGMNAHAVASVLEKEGVVSDGTLFYWYARIHGLADKMKAGEYRFPPGVSPRVVLDTLVQGKVVVHKVTIPEGATLKDVARLVAKTGLVDANHIVDLAQDRHLMISLGVRDAGSLEGYLFPETYLFRRTDRPRDMVRRMVLEFWRRFSPERQAQARQMGFTVHQAVTLASLVEKEAVVDAERPVIAGVFLNRLQRDMPLQSDPTAVYDLEDFAGPIRRRHLDRESPYNTYLHKGLPPGPICNPGEKSLRAVLDPKKNAYLYFVSNNDGTHTFSATYDEHLQAVARFRALKEDSRSSAKTPLDESEASIVP
ncbi:MAG: endolytic transglycosylase MltG [Desulfosoma sp.]